MSVNEKMKAIADAIRGKTGKTDTLTLDQMATEIAGIETGGGSDDVLLRVLARTITNLESDKVTELGYRALNGCTALTSISFPNCVKMSEGALQGTSVETVNLPNLDNIADRCFMSCSKLKEIVFPNVKDMPTYVFYECLALEKCDLHTITTIGNRSFQNCKNLKALIIRTNSLCNLVGSDVLAGSGVASGTGYIYVPSVLIDTYKAATNWSVYANQFRTIEGSEYE